MNIQITTQITYRDNLLTALESTLSTALQLYIVTMSDSITIIRLFISMEDI